MTRLNLLPWREMRRKVQDRNLISVAVGSCVLMIVIVGFAYWQLNGMIENQTQRNDFLVKETKKIEEELKEIAELEKRRDDLIARMNVIEQLQQDRTRIVHVFDDLVRKLPEGVYLTTLKQAGANFTISGVAQSNARVSAFMRNLDSSEWFVNPDLDVINVSAKGSDRLSQFTLRVHQKVKPKEPPKESKEIDGPKEGGGAPAAGAPQGAKAGT
jgi:type IV pilus assembly protein PilN